jgi:hypothetical protein
VSFVVETPGTPSFWLGDVTHFSGVRMVSVVSPLFEEMSFVVEAPGTPSFRLHQLTHFSGVPGVK